MILKNEVNIKGDHRLNNETVRQLWQQFTFCSTLRFHEGEKCTFSLGDALPPSLESGKEYALLVTDTGAAVRGADYGGLIRGMAALLMRICHQANGCILLPAFKQSNYRLKNRMIHLCVFPEQDFSFIQKVIRLIGLCQYTHIVLEFWGMLQFNCLKELAWPEAFTKKQATELLQEIRELGMEPIPMFNHLGHASGSRKAYGKHVVLDQAPQLQYLFTPDGWVWNMEEPQTKALLKEVRQELYDLFGQGEYLHIGCDEAYFITHHEALRKKLPAHLGALTQEIAAEGRKPMLWMDMLLEDGKYQGYKCTGKREEIHDIIDALAKESVLVDWQYDITEAPICTAVDLKKSGHAVLGAPWYEPANYRAHIQTAEEHDLHGVMMTTWHTLKERMVSIAGCAKELGASLFPWGWERSLYEETSTLLRRVSYNRNSTASAGWAQKQIDV